MAKCTKRNNKSYNYLAFKFTNMQNGLERCVAANRRPNLNSTGDCPPDGFGWGDYRCDQRRRFFCEGVPILKTLDSLRGLN